MNTKLLLFSFILAGFTSCSTAYKTAQTPDDVYFSPAPPHVDYVSTRNEDDRTVYNGESIDDRQIRTTIHNRRWRKLHRYDYDYGYYPYGYYPYGYYPYGYPVYIDPKTNTSQPRKYNLGTYKNPETSPTSVFGSKTGTQPSTSPVRTFPAQPSKPSANGSAVGNLLRKVFSGSNESYSSDDNSSRTRTFDSKNSSSSSSSGSNKSSNNAPVRTFPKK
jgi:hypothetical protein